MKAIIVYEVFNREYDNCLLLQAALDHHGISADIVYKMDLVSITPSEEKVLLLVPNSYDDTDFQYYYYTAAHKNAIIVNLQYEQVLSDDPENIREHTPKGRAAYIYNLCWGNGFKTFLTNIGIDQNLSFVGGALQLDFMKSEFSDYWEKREELIKKYNLPSDKKWILFISSFAYANNPFVNSASDRVYGKDNNADFRQLSEISRTEIINWFQSYLNGCDDKVIIYRKHPMEKYDNLLLELQKKYSRKFYLIDDYNIKQWIFSSDYVLNWYSTSAVECVAANKHFEILRPYKIKDSMEVVLFKKARLIESYENLRQLLDGEIVYDDYPFDISLIQEMYEIDYRPAFEKISAFLEQLSKQELMPNYIDDNYYETRKNYLLHTHIKPKYRIKKIYQAIYRKTHIGFPKCFLRNKFAIDDWEFQARLLNSNTNNKNIITIVDDYYLSKKSCNN